MYLRSLNRPLGVYYTPNRQWIDFQSGYCGLTQFALKEKPKSLQYCHYFRIKGHIQIDTSPGFLLLSEKEEIPFLSPISGRLTKVNRLLKYDSEMWIYQVKYIEDYTSELMDYWTYMSNTLEA